MTSTTRTAPAAGVNAPATLFRKAPTGVPGFDDITAGGLPRGRTTLVIGGPGAGKKTVFGLEFLARGARDYDEPGILVAFEESAEQLIANAASFGWDLQ